MNYYNKTEASVKTFLSQIAGRNTKSNRTTIYRTLLKNQNATKNDLIRIIGMKHQTLTSQLSVLMDMGLVEVTGTIKTIGLAGEVFESTFKVQKDENRIYINQVERRTLKFKRLKKQLKEFADMFPDNISEAINNL